MGHRSGLDMNVVGLESVRNNVTMSQDQAALIERIEKSGPALSHFALSVIIHECVLLEPP